jgi:hypothetical protein
MSRYFKSMTNDRDRCIECHLPQDMHFNGACPEECTECAMVASGQFMTADDHDNDCSRFKERA